MPLITPLVRLTTAAKPSAHQKFLTLNPGKNQSATCIIIAFSSQVKIPKESIPKVTILRTVPNVMSSRPTTIATQIDWTKLSNVTPGNNLPPIKNATAAINTPIIKSIVKN